MYLKKDNLVIRNASKEDAVLLCIWWNDGRVMAHAGFPYGLETTVDTIEEKLSKDNDLGRRLIIEIDGQPAGEMNYRTVAEYIAEIGIKICDFTKQNAGNGTKLLRMLIDFLFEDMNYIKIILDTNLNNNRAQHVYEKLGFKRTGIRTDAFKDQNGISQTLIDYELTREDFKTHSVFSV